MGDEKHQCGLCKNMIAKKKFFGGVSYRCSILKHEVSVTDSCSKFVRDGDKVLQHARFRPHEYGTCVNCDNCVHLGYKKTHQGGLYLCKINKVNFGVGFHTHKYVCDNYEQMGALEVFIRGTKDEY